MNKQLSWFNKLMMAVTFAEANEHETARQLTNKDMPNKSENERKLHLGSGKKPLTTDLKTATA